MIRSKLLLVLAILSSAYTPAKALKPMDVIKRGVIFALCMESTVLTIGLVLNAEHMNGPLFRHMVSYAANQAALKIAAVTLVGVSLERALTLEAQKQAAKPNKTIENGALGFKALVGGPAEEIQELLDIIKGTGADYAKFGISHPKGFILTGPPGTGKTAQARALAEECEFAFLAANSTNFKFEFTGQGAQAMRSVFSQAKNMAKANKYGKAILFIDEIDQIAGSRSRDRWNCNSEILTELLVQLDGFASDDSVIVIGATNRPDNLDDAVKRAGRLDTIIEIGLPDKEKRLAMLEFYSADKPLASDVDLNAVADAIDGCNAADTKNIVTMAAKKAVKDKADAISQKDFAHAVNKWYEMEASKRKSYID